MGDGIREDVEDIVAFVQRHSGLNFNLALVEAALYRDGERSIIVQPRVLARTEIVQRIVVDRGGLDIPPDGESPEDTLSDQDQENLRFWTAVLQDFSFSDVEVEVPMPRKDAIIWVKVRDSGFGGYGLPFAAYLYRKNSSIGCYLSYRKGIEPATRIFGEIETSLDALRDELGDEAESWTDQGRPRIGFWRRIQFPLPEDKHEEFRAAVAWMRERLDRLVSTLHPHLRRMIDAGS